MAARHAPLSMGFPRQEYWSGLPFLSSEYLPGPNIEFKSPAVAGEFFTTEPLVMPRKLFSNGIVTQCQGIMPQLTC